MLDASYNEHEKDIMHELLYIEHMVISKSSYDEEYIRDKIRDLLIVIGTNKVSLKKTCTHGYYIS